jgi:hypothetical protein
VAVSIGGGGVFLAQASPGANESTIVSVAPARVLDTRDPLNVGLSGPFVSGESQKLVVTGAVPTTTGTATVVPVGATGVLLNVTAVSATADGFISVRPGDASGVPSTSSLNFSAGSVVPNAVQVAVPATGANAGQIDITYDAYGAAGQTTDVLVDVVGYTTNQGIQSLVADLASKANISALPIGNSGRVNSVAANLVFGVNTILVSTTISAPVPGVIQIAGSHGALGVGAASVMTCALTIGAGSTSSAGDLASTSRTEALGASGPGHCSTTGSVAVGAGTHTVNLVANGATGIDVRSATINAVFYPN